MIASDHENLKNIAPNGSRVNPVWYNPISINHKKPEEIIERMYQRFLNFPLNRFANKVIFYDNKTKKHLKEFE